jgi:hypothetical protein
MATGNKLGLWIGCAACVGLVSLVSSGCGFIIGIKDVPNGGADGGRDATTGPDGTTPGPDGSHPKTDGGSGGKDTGGMQEGSGPIDSPAPEGGGGGDAGASVFQYHMNLNRDGHYIDPLMTLTHAAKMTIDTTFNGGIQGPLWGQPLYVEDGVGGKGTYYVADDGNDIYALDETTGTPDWKLTPLAMSAGQAGSGCGNVTPVGVTGTPIIDITSRTMYFVAAVGIASGIQSHEIYAVSIDTGTTKAGYPIDVNNIMSSSGPSTPIKFNPQPQGQRSAMALLNGYLYASWGGEDGDCGNYNGWVVAVPVADPTTATGFATAGARAGMWAVGGLASDGTDVFAVSGNGIGSGSWAGAESEAIFRFTNGTAFDATKTADFFAPSNWQSLDDSDTDLVGAGPLVLDVAGATPSALVIAMGKSGILHILDKANLGGVGTGDGTTGEGLWSDQVAGGAIRGAAASFTTSTGTYVALRADGNGTSCPGAAGDLVVGQITATNPPTFKTIWCADSGGNGSPIVTTTDAAGSNPIVWIVGTEGSNLLQGWNGTTGVNVFNGAGMAMDTVIHWTTLLDVKGRLIVGANDKVYAFTSTTP